MGKSKTDAPAEPVAAEEAATPQVISLGGPPPRSPATTGDSTDGK
jgi:hypothetical protein